VAFCSHHVVGLGQRTPGDCPVQSLKTLEGFWVSECEYLKSKCISYAGEATQDQGHQ
jgi:hypothetical protein